MALHDYTEALAAARAFWAPIAKEHDWYSEPFFVQVWVNESGEVTDSVAHRDMVRDIVIETVLAPFCVYCAEDYGYDGDSRRTASLVEEDDGAVYCYQCESTIDEEYAVMAAVEQDAR